MIALYKEYVRVLLAQMLKTYYMYNIMVTLLTTHVESVYGLCKLHSVQ